MKKTVRIRESQLNDIIKKVIREQEGQVMNTGPSPEQMVGTADGENDAAPHATEEPDFGEFINCAKQLLDQGVTIGNLIDQVLDAQNDESSEDSMPVPNPDTEGGIEPEVPMG